MNQKISESFKKFKVQYANKVFGGTVENCLDVVERNSHSYSCIGDQTTEFYDWTDGLIEPVADSPSTCDPSC